MRPRLRKCWAPLIAPLAISGLLAGCGGGGGETPPGLGDPAQGRIVVVREACGSCHAIPGVPQADGVAGPPLTHFAERTVVAGVLPNRPDELVLWLRAPQRVVPGNAMPDMGLSERQARDVAAFLYTLG